MIELNRYFQRKPWEIRLSTNWVSKILNCITNTSFSIFINRKPRGNFTRSRGFRLGCHLSPHLLILFDEGFYSRISEEIHLTYLNKIKVTCSDPSVSHLLFAEANVSEARILKEVLFDYEKALVQVVNLQSFGIGFSPNVWNDLVVALQSVLGIPKVSCHAWYLGLPATTSRDKNSLFRNLRIKL